MTTVRLVAVVVVMIHEIGERVAAKAKEKTGLSRERTRSQWRASRTTCPGRNSKTWAGSLEAL